MKKTKKIMLGIGTVIATSVPVITVIACGQELTPKKIVDDKKLKEFKSIILETLEIENNEIDIDKINQGLDKISKLFKSNYKVKFILDKKNQTNESLSTKENVLQEGDSLQIELEMKSGAINIMPLLSSIKEGKKAPNLLNDSNILKKGMKKSTDEVVVSANDITFLLSLIDSIKDTVKKIDFSKLMSSTSKNGLSSLNSEDILPTLPTTTYQSVSTEMKTWLGIKSSQDMQQKFNLFKKNISIFLDIFLLQYKMEKFDNASEILELVSDFVKK